jgi:probable phosphoglycerate mutase
MTIFFLLRHAAHDNLGRFLAGRSANVSLGAQGRAQALRLGARMRQEGCDAIFSSPSERTQETAQAVSVACAIGPVTVRGELDEIDFGPWSGKTFAELNNDPNWRHWNSRRDIAVTPAGESMADARRRVCGFMEDLAQEFPQGRMALVSHADVIKSVICHVLGLSADRCFRFDIQPASVSIVTMGETEPRLLRLNETV